MTSPREHIPPNDPPPLDRVSESDWRYIALAREDLFRDLTDFSDLLVDFRWLRERGFARLSAQVSSQTCMASIKERILDQQSRSQIWCSTHAPLRGSSDSPLDQVSCTSNDVQGIVAYYDAYNLTMMTALHSMQYILSTAETSYLSGVTTQYDTGESCSSTASILLLELGIYAVAMKEAYTLASTAASTPLRLLDHAIHGMRDLTDSIPSWIKSLVDASRLSYEERSHLASVGSSEVAKVW